MSVNLEIIEGFLTCDSLTIWIKCHYNTFEKEKK